MGDDVTEKGEPATSSQCEFTASVYSDRLSGRFDCSRPIWEAAESNCCVWHAEQADKPPDELATTVEEGLLPGAYAPETDLTEVEFPETPVLTEANFSGANLKMANLSGADLRRANLSGARLLGADLSGTALENVDFSEAYLADADLSEAGLNYSSSDMQLMSVEPSVERIVSADFSRAHLQDADLTKVFLPAADFSEARLGKANLAEANLREADVSNAGLNEANLSNAGLDSADFSGAHVSEAVLSEGDFTDADFSGADLSECKVVRATFEGANFQSATLPTGTQLAGADLTEANLVEGDFRDQDLSGAQLPKANLTDADLSGTDLSEANLERALLNRADLFDTCFAGARVEGTVFGDAQINAGTFEQLAQSLHQPTDRSLRTRLTRLIIGPTGHDPSRCVYDPKSQFSETEAEYTETRSDDLVDTDGYGQADDPAVRASSVYRQFERLARENALPNWQQRFFILRQDMQTRKKVGGEYWFALLQRTVFGYGESFSRVIGWSSGVILLFAMAYLLTGTIRPVESGGELGAAIVWTRLPEVPALLWESLYYSTLTFTALGFGDFRPTNTLGQVLTVVETGTGAVLVALLVFVLGRRAAR